MRRLSWSRTAAADFTLHRGPPGFLRPRFCPLTVATPVQLRIDHPIGEHAMQFMSRKRAKIVRRLVRIAGGYGPLDDAMTHLEKTKGQYTATELVDYLVEKRLAERETTTT